MKIFGRASGFPLVFPFILASLSQSFQLFFVGVSRFAENNLGPPPLEGYVSSDSVLHRLAAELYSIVYPTLSTWEAVRDRMAANEAEWSLPLSEELPEGLSDESPGRVTREVSSEATPSTSGSRQLAKVDRSWKALSYFSKINQDDIDRIRRCYQIPDNVVLRILDPDERACCPKYEGDVAFYEADFRAGLRFPMQPFVSELLDFLGLAPGQVNPNGWRTIISCMVMWRVNSNGQEDLTVDEFLFCYEPCQIALSRGFWTFKNRDANTRIVQGLPSSDRIWKDGYFFVCGDNWERLPQEDPRDFVGVRRSWGTPSSSVLDRPLLDPVWKERISRILDIQDRRYTIFIEPDLLASFSFGPIPSSTVKALLKANRKRANTMKLNKSRLRQLAQSGEVAADLFVLKRKRAGEGSSRRAEESPHVAMDRAKAAFTFRDMDDYAAAHTEDVHYLLVHSLMRGLNEAMVMSQRCISVEEDFATLRSKSMADEAKLKNARRAVLELTRERKDVMDEAEKVNVELKARDKDVEVAVAAKDKVVADLQHLVGQVEGSKAAAVSEFRASEAFEDINTRYFLFGFEAFRKQAAQRFLDLDFSALQPYDDEDSVVDASQDQAGDDDVSSK
uniref:Transposase (putative) gypsy type domain-containing protein n=1 Tax=Fagus sylvatica TaxID=28930 RepID=A0A2N9GGL5_FAGSY